MLYSYPLVVALIWGVVLCLIKKTKTPPIYGLGISLVCGMSILAVAKAVAYICFNQPFLIAWNIDWLYVFLVGMLRYVIGTWTLYLSVSQGDMSIATPIIATKVIFVSALSVLLGMETITVWLSIAVIFAAIGFALLSHHIEKTEHDRKKILLRSGFFAFITMIVWTIADIMVKKISTVNPLDLTLGSLLGSVIVYYALMTVTKNIKKIWSTPRRDKVLFMVHGVFSLGIVYFLMNISLFELGIIKTNIIINLWPVIASFMGFWLFKERMSTAKIIGIGLLVSSVFIVVFS